MVALNHSCFSSSSTSPIFEHTFSLFKYSQEGSRTLGKLGRDRVFSIWGWSGGGCLFIRDIVGPEFLSTRLACSVTWFLFIFICLNRRYFKFCSIIKYPISQDHRSRYNLKIFINVSLRAIFLKMKCNSNLQAPGLISPIRTWNLHQSCSKWLGSTWVFKL